MAKTIFNKVKNSKIPVIKKELDDGVIAEANNDGTIYVDKDVKPGSPLEKEAIAHEMVHMDQMKRGDLNYDDKNVYWKGKKYDRDDMNEGSKKLPWEKEAYDKTDHIDGNLGTINKNDMKKSSPNKIIYQQGGTRLSGRTLNQRASILNDQLAIKADKHAAIGEQVGKIQKQLYEADFSKDKDDTRHDTSDGPDNTNNDNTDPNVESSNDDGKGAGMNYKNKNKNPIKMKATPITMKAKGSPAKAIGALVSAVAPALIKGAASAIGSKLGKKAGGGIMMKQSPFKVDTTATRSFKGNLGDQSGTFTETKTNKKGKTGSAGTGVSFDTAWNNMSDEKKAEFENKADFVTQAKAYNQEKYGTADEVKYETTFKGDTKKETSQEPGTPGTPDKYNMGYYESMDAKYGAGVRNRGRKKVDRNLKRAGNKYDRKGGNIVNPETGENFASKAEYLKYVAKSVSGTYDIPIGKTRMGKPGTEAGPEVTTESNVEANPDQDTYVINDDGTTSKVDTAAEMNKKNKNKGPFKMKGFSGFNK